MMVVSRALSGLRRLIFWDFIRGSWQYDIIVAAILAFIFLSPREWFKDQPRATSIVMLPAERGTNVFWMESALLSSVPEQQRTTKAEALLNARTGHPHGIVRLEPILDSEHEIQGFLAYTTP